MFFINSINSLYHTCVIKSNVFLSDLKGQGA